MKRASIDIGSNTVLLLIADCDGDKLIKELENESRVTSLGKGLDKNGVFATRSMQDTKEAILEYKAIIDRHDILAKDVIITATEAARVAKNSNEFFDELTRVTGFHFKIISGEAEAYYTSLGVVKGSELNTSQVTIMDIGGASTELINIQLSPFRILSTVSLPMGSVRCTDWLGDGIFEKKAKEILNNYSLEQYQTEHLLCVAGSMTSLGAMIKGLKEFDPAGVNGVKISFDDFLKFSKKIKMTPVDKIAEKFPFLGKRVHSIIGGAMLGEVLGSALNVRTFEISTLGLRYGTLISGGVDERFCR